MPKQKLDPKFPKAASFQGAAKAVYLAGGELDPAANQLVLKVKHAHWAKVREAKKTAIVSGTEVDAAERAAALTDARRGLVAKYNESLLDCGEMMRCAILNNDAVFFRQIADVIEQHKANGEAVFKDRIRSRPTNPLAHAIALWDMVEQGQKTFEELWNFLEGLEHFRYGALKTSPRGPKRKSSSLSPFPATFS